MVTAVSEKTTVRASRDTREGKTFTAADVEFLRRPLASQLVTVTPWNSTTDSDVVPLRRRVPAFYDDDRSR